MIKQTIIVASGLGTRMGELTYHKPKCLLEISGHPILKYILDGAINIGAEKIIMDVSERYRGQIEEYTNKHFPSLKTFFSYSSYPRGVGYSIYNTLEYVNLNEPALITVSDVICFDGYRILEQVLHDADIALGVSSYPLISDKKYTRACIDKNKRLQFNKFTRAHNQTYPLIGIYALKPLDVFFNLLGSTIEALNKNKLSMEEAKTKNIFDSKNELRLSFVFELMNRGRYKTVLPNMGRCCEINTPENLTEAEKENGQLQNNHLH